MGFKSVIVSGASLVSGFAASHVTKEILIGILPETTSRLEQAVRYIGIASIGLAVSNVVGGVIEKEVLDEFEFIESLKYIRENEKEAKNERSEHGGTDDE